MQKAAFDIYRFSLLLSGQRMRDRVPCRDAEQLDSSTLLSFSEVS